MELAISQQPEKVGIKRIISTVLHQIDVDNQECKHIQISNDHSDLEGYLSDLLSEINNKEQKRAFDFLRETTEFYTALTSFIENKKLSDNLLSSNIAHRLLDKEIATDDKYGHLGKNDDGHVKKGSFLQFLYRDGDVISYLGVKIEYQVFLDEIDFKRKIGLSIANKIYKACKVEYNENNLPSSVFVYDTNSKPSVYWWNEFLELKEVRNDAHNTRTASKEVIKVINRIKKDHPEDYTILRNQVIASFKQKGQMKYDEFIDNTIRNYEPVDKVLTDKLPKIINTLEQLPSKKKFDTNFTLVPSEVPYKRSTYTLSREISISVDDGIENLDDKIWAEKSVSGQELVIIESSEGYKRFTKKNRD